MNYLNLQIVLLVIALTTCLSVAKAQECPEIEVAPDGTVTFTFPSDPGFDISAIGTSNGGLPASVVYTGSGSFTGANVYTLENASPLFPPSLTGSLVLDFTGTGFIVCDYGFVPLELTSFTGRTTEQNTNLLQWITATESNTQWIILERSADAADWEVVERLPAQGWSATLTEYSSEDLNPYLMTYYRLRMIDLDGAEYYSDVLALERNSLSGMTISPIPAKDEVFLQFEDDTEGEVTISIIDIYGRELSKEIIPTIVGLNTKEIDIKAYASGLYYITIDNGIDQQTKRMIKQE